TSGGLAGGNVISGLNTLTGAAGKDFGGMGALSVQAGTYELTYGNLTIDAKGNYSYALSVPQGNVPTGAIDTFHYNVTDSKGAISNPAILTIELNPEETLTQD